MSQLRELSALDAPRYNAFLSEGTRRHVRTLRIAPEDVASSPFALGANAEHCTLALVDDADTFLAVGSLEREGGRLKRRHIAWIVRMLVGVPGQGYGRAVLRELKARARLLPGVEKVNLTVAADNLSAVHLYQSEGFVEFSRELDAFRSEAQSITELTMSWVVGA